MDPIKSACATLGEVYENITLIDEEMEITRLPVISNQAMSYINLYINFVLTGAMSVFGLFNNILNMVIFYKLGLKDSMSVGLMGLSITDFLVSFFSVIRTSFFLWNRLAPNLSINPLAIHYVSFGYWRDIMFLCSAWITTFISIERCVCVVFPFKVKDIFTKVRTIVVVVIIFVVNIGAHIPALATQGLEWETIEQEISNNRTALIDRLVIKLADNRPQVQIYIDIANGAILPMPSQALLLISVLWMIYGLKASSKIRGNIVTSHAEEVGKKKESNLSQKEKRLVKMVLFLAIILTICNIPRFIAVYVKQIFPDVDYGKFNDNLYMMFWGITYAANSINSSINIFVYLTINSNYRHKFKALIWGKR